MNDGVTGSIIGIMFSQSRHGAAQHVAGYAVQRNYINGPLAFIHDWRRRIGAPRSAHFRASESILQALSFNPITSPNLNDTFCASQFKGHSRRLITPSYHTSTLGLTLDGSNSSYRSNASSFGFRVAYTAPEPETYRSFMATAILSLLIFRRKSVPRNSRLTSADYSSSNS